jgi:uncharacterized protein (DUF1697 family)
MKFVALLRGINVGGNKKISMPELKTTFESLGFVNVSTYINSGNIIFETATRPDVSTIETTLQKSFGFSVKILIRDQQNIQNLVKKIPSDWQNNSDQRTDVLFLWDEYCNPKTVDLIKINPTVDHLEYISGTIVWNFDRINYSKSAMHKFIGTTVYKNMTARNINTVRKLAQLVK